MPPQTPSVGQRIAGSTCGVTLDASPVGVDGWSPSPLGVVARRRSRSTVLALYALAIYLARGERRETLRNIGFAFVLAALIAIGVVALRHQTKREFPRRDGRCRRRGGRARLTRAAQAPRMVCGGPASVLSTRL